MSHMTCGRETRDTNKAVRERVRIPEIMIQAIQHYTLLSIAYVEVKGRCGILITIKKGSGQGYPLSSILFLIASEPLNRLFAKAILHLMYITMEGATVGLLLYADNNLTPPSNCSS
jgi:hypothetical protein